MTDKKDADTKLDAGLRVLVYQLIKTAGADAEALREHLGIQGLRGASRRAAAKAKRNFGKMDSRQRSNVLAVLVRAAKLEDEATAYLDKDDVLLGLASAAAMQRCVSEVAMLHLGLQLAAATKQNADLQEARQEAARQAKAAAIAYWHPDPNQYPDKSAAEAARCYVHTHPGFKVRTIAGWLREHAKEAEIKR